MQKVLKINVFGQIVAEGYLVHGVYVSADRNTATVVFPFPSNGVILATDNEQNFYVTYASVSTESGKLSRLGSSYVYYHWGSSYDNNKISKIGDVSVYYWPDGDPVYYGKIKSVDGKNVYYWPDNDPVYYGKVKSVDGKNVYYWPGNDSDRGKVKTVYDTSVYYDSWDGRLKTIGSYSVYYDGGKVRSIGSYSLY